MSKKQNSKEANFIDYETTKGEMLRFYAVSDDIVNAVLPPEPKPKRPFVVMQTKVGEQKRPAKQGDMEWDEYQDELDEWNRKRDVLRGEVKLVLSLRDYKYPDANAMLRPDMQELVEDGLLEIVHPKWSMKALHLKQGPLESNVDDRESFYIIQELSGMPEEVIVQMKEDFRNLLLRPITPILGGEDSERFGTSGENGEVPSVEEGVGSISD